MKTIQELLFNGVKATIRETDDGQLELVGDEFIEELLHLGFRPGRNDTPERLEEILKHVPETFRQAFWNGYHGRQRLRLAR